MDIRDAEEDRRYWLIHQIGGTGSVFLLAFGANAFLNGHAVLAGILPALATLTVASMAVLRLTGGLQYGAYGVSAAMVLVFSYLIISGSGKLCGHQPRFG